MTRYVAVLACSCAALGCSSGASRSPGPPDPSRSDVAAVPSSGAENTGLVVVTVRDASGVAVGGAPVSLRADWGISLASPSGTTASDGTFQSMFTFVADGRWSVAARVGADEAFTLETDAEPWWCQWDGSGLSWIDAVPNRAVANGTQSISLSRIDETGLYAFGTGTCFNFPASWTVTGSGNLLDDSHPIVQLASTVPERKAVEARSSSDTIGAATGVVFVPEIHPWSRTPTRPGTAPVTSLASATGVLYAAADDVCRSLDGGETWSCGAVVPGNDARARFVAVDPDAPATVFVAADGLGVFRSDDGGTTFSDISSGLTDLDVVGLAYDPAFRVLFAWTRNELLFRRAGDGPFEEIVNQPAAGVTVAPGGGLAVTSVKPRGQLLGETIPPGLQATTDGGATWFSLGMPVLPSSPVMLGGAISVAFGASRDELLALKYASVVVAPRRGSHGADVYRSSDGGATWSFEYSSWALYVQAGAAPPSRLVSSPDGGAVFLLGGGARASPPRHWLQKSATDDLAFFMDVADGLPEGRVNDLAFDRSVSGRVYAATDEGVFVSTTGGE